MSNKELKSNKHIELNAVIRQGYPRAYQVFTPYALSCICVKNFLLFKNRSVLEYLNCKIFLKIWGFCCILKIRIIILGSAGFKLFICKYMQEDNSRPLSICATWLGKYWILLGENNIFIPYFIEYFDREYVKICKFQFSQQSKQYLWIDCKN